MIIEKVSLVAEQGRRDELRRALSAMLEPTAVEPGCLGARLFQDANNQNMLSVETRWRDESDLIKHLRSEHYRSLLVLMESSAEQPVIEFHTVAKSQGLEFVEAVR